jgi:hypothetical protein
MMKMKKKKKKKKNSYTPFEFGFRRFGFDFKNKSITSLLLENNAFKSGVDPFYIFSIQINQI